MSNGSWRVDETYVKVKGRWMYLYRAVDSRGQTIDFLLSAKRDAEAAKRFSDGGVRPAGRRALVCGDTGGCGAAGCGFPVLPVRGP
jgi:transposase-like protein